MPNIQFPKNSSLDEETIDDILYYSRSGDTEALRNFFSSNDFSLIKNIIDSQTLNTPIHMAAGNGHNDVIIFLLSFFSKNDLIQLISSKNSDGNTPLHWASINGHLETVKLLCSKYGANILEKNNFGHDSMHEAEFNNKQEVVSWLINEIDVNKEFYENDHHEQQVTFA